MCIDDGDGDESHVGLRRPSSPSSSNPLYHGFPVMWWNCEFHDLGGAVACGERACVMGLGAEVRVWRLNGSSCDFSSPSLS